MKAKALRGVCIGPGQHLQPGDVADLDAGTFQFLSFIGAVEAAPADEAPAQAEPKPTTAPAKAGKKES